MKLWDLYFKDKSEKILLFDIENIHKTEKSYYTY